MTAPELPAPLVPAEVDLRDFGFMPLDVRTLLTSSFWIKAKKDPRVAHAAMSLWCEAWHQVPAASLPNDDEVLAELARCDDKEWKRVKDRALAHFVECSDGRLYHRHVAKKALESWASKQAQRERTRKATEARKKPPAPSDDDGTTGKGPSSPNRDDDRDGARHDERDDQRDDDRDVHQGTVKGREETEKESANALSARGAVGIALKAGGIDPLSFNTDDPRVDALIAAGATPQQWEGLAREAVTSRKAKPFAWVLAVLPERLKTAGGIKANGKHAGFAAKDYRAGDGSDGLIPG